MPVYEISNVARLVADEILTGIAGMKDIGNFPNVAPLHTTYWFDWAAPYYLRSTGSNPPDRVAILFCQAGTEDEQGQWAVGASVWGQWRKDVTPLVTWRLIMHRDGSAVEVVHKNIFPGISDWFNPPTSPRNITTAQQREVALQTVEELSQSFTETSSQAELIERGLAEAKKKRAAAEQELQKIRDEFDAQIEKYLSHMVLNVSLMAHSLLACKNVFTEEQIPAAAVSKKFEKKHGHPLVRYKTLVIQPMGGSRTGNTSERGGESARSAHIVRGHFKTFTEDRPLFGKWTGTYWWSQAVKGNPERGVILKDYRVKSPEIAS